MYDDEKDMDMVGDFGGGGTDDDFPFEEEEMDFPGENVSDDEEDPGEAGFH